MKKLSDLLGKKTVLPIAVIHDARDAVPLADALHEGGLNVIEIVLRTPAAIEAIETIRLSFPHMHVGAGTVLNSTSIAQSLEAGASFLVSPGLTAELAQMAKGLSVPFLPGAATASEVMHAVEQNFTEVTFFPAALNGGPVGVKAMSDVFPDINFIPTGGIAAKDVHDYLSLHAVSIVGGSWIVAHDLIRDKNWQEITKRAKEAKDLCDNRR